MCYCLGFLLNAFATNDLSVAHHGLRISHIRHSYERIFRSYDEQTIIHVGTACLSSLRLISNFLTTNHRQGDSGIELEDRQHGWMRVLVIVMLNPVFGEALASGGELVEQIASLIPLLTPTAKEVISIIIPPSHILKSLSMHQP